MHVREIPAGYGSLDEQVVYDRFGLLGRFCAYNLHAPLNIWFMVQLLYLFPLFHLRNKKTGQGISPPPGRRPLVVHLFRNN